MVGTIESVGIWVVVLGTCKGSHRGYENGGKVITAGDTGQKPTGNKVSLVLLLAEQLVLIKLPFHFWRENAGRIKKGKGKTWKNKIKLMKQHFKIFWVLFSFFLWLGFFLVNYSTTPFHPKNIINYIYILFLLKHFQNVISVTCLLLPLC